LYDALTDRLHESGIDVITPMKIMVNPAHEIIAIEYGNKDTDIHADFPDRIDRFF